MRNGDHRHRLSPGQAPVPGPIAPGRGSSRPRQPWKITQQGLAGSGNKEAPPGSWKTKVRWKIVVCEEAAMGNGRKTPNLARSQCGMGLHRG